MTGKKKALKALIILAIVLAASMFFGNTLQTITTAKVEIIRATKGKLEDSIALEGSIHFSKGEEIVAKEAAGMDAVVTKVLAKEGYFVKKGDLLFSLMPTGYEEKYKTAMEEYKNAIREYAVEYASKQQLAKTSDQNDAYNEFLLANDDYFLTMLKVKTLAADLGYELPENIEDWVALNPEPEENVVKYKKYNLKGLNNRTATALKLDENTYPGLAQKMLDAYNADKRLFNASAILKYIYKGQYGMSRIGDTLFESIKKIDELYMKIEKAEQNVIDLEEKIKSIGDVYAPRDGYITSISIKAGDSYDGIKPLYTMSLEGEHPLIRCDITGSQKPLTKGTAVSVEGLEKSVKITNISIEVGGKKYAEIALSDDNLSKLGGLTALMDKTIAVTATYKAQKATTLIPASALRSEGEDKYFVYVVRTSWGGLLSNNTMTLEKREVKVLDKSDKVVSLEDDLSYVDIADHEDRTVKDGQQVMKYVD